MVPLSLSGDGSVDGDGGGTEDGSRLLRLLRVVVKGK